MIKKIIDFLNNLKWKIRRKKYELTDNGKCFYEYAKKIAEKTYTDSDYNYYYEEYISTGIERLISAYGKEAFLKEGESLTDLTPENIRYRESCMICSVIEKLTEQNK